LIKRIHFQPFIEEIRTLNLAKLKLKVEEALKQTISEKETTKQAINLIEFWIIQQSI
jgi:hypothetical protein